MLTPEQRDRLEVVLVSPRNPLNIGAVARAMANFGFSRLTVVAPYEPHWREARSAVGAPDLLQNARSTECLAEAVADCTFVAGTGTLAHRKPEQPVSLLARTLRRLVAEATRARRPHRPGLRSRRNTALRATIFPYCHVLVEIPTDPRQPSMNLGQAVAVCLYELARWTGMEESDAGLRGFPPFPRKKTERTGHGALEGHGAWEGQPASASAALDRLAGLVEETMVAAGYSPRAMQPANRHDLRLLLRRLAPSALDTRRMLGLFRRILYRLNRASERSRT